MRKVLMGVAVLATLAFANVSHAVVGTAAMSWTGCNVPVTSDIAVPEGSATAAKLFVYVTGHDESSQSYEVWMLYGSSANHTVPDAWRFDPVGCQGTPFIKLNYVPPSSVAKTCLSFQDAGGPKSSFQVTRVDFSPATLPYQTSLMLIQLADLYGLTPNTPSAAAKYFLMDVEMDETFGTVAPTDPIAGTCGGVNTSMCFNLNRCAFVTADGSTAVNFNFYGGADWVTANAGGAGGCQGTPVQPKTWGQIKNQYRN